jgi:hypothetical protein
MSLALLGAAQERDRGASRFFLAGICAGFLPVIRPTALAFSAAGLLFASRSQSRERWSFLAGAALGATPGVAWNLAVFHSLIGGYAIIESSYTFTPAQAYAGILGLLVSPSRGLLVYSPFVIFSIAGIVAARRQRTAAAHLVRYLAAASLVTFVNYAFFQRWEGGSAFGPRYLTDTMPAAALALVFLFPRDLRGATFRARVAAFACIGAIVSSMLVQVAGANGEPKTNWSGVPYDAALHRERLWEWRDEQIVRDARATMHLWTRNPTFAQAYATGFNGTIAGLETDTATAITRASVRNTGIVPWYGYTTGLYFGQARVRVRYLDRAGHVAGQDYLYITGSPRPGQVACAVGTPAAAPPRGTTPVYDIDVFQDARIGSRHVGERTFSSTTRLNSACTH